LDSFSPSSLSAPAELLGRRQNTKRVEKEWKTAKKKNDKRQEGLKSGRMGG